MNWPLYRSLHARGLTQQKLAARTGIHRTVLARILTNEPGRGQRTRPKLFPHLTEAEIGLLGWTEEFRKWESGKQKTEIGKAESGKAESGKAESGKAESGKAESGKAEGGNVEGSTGNIVPVLSDGHL